MRILRRRIERVLTQGGVAESAFSSPFEQVLHACSQVYELAARFRIRLYERGILKQECLSCKVVSIGNITVGGTGKTPVTVFMGDLLKRMGYKVAVISRGYGGSAEKHGGIVSDGQATKMGPQQAGDEPYLMSLKLKGIPVIVGQDRVKAGQVAIDTFGSDVVVLDDGFQHLRLKRDLNFVLLDASNPFGNGRLLPRGVLREPLRHLDRADAFVVTSSSASGALAGGISSIQEIAAGRPIFCCTRVPHRLVGNGETMAYPLDFLRGRRLLAFSAIARNEDFRQMVMNLGGDIVKFFPFPDHHYYSDDDLRSVAALGESLNAEFLITTEKDYVRIQDRLPGRLKLVVLTVAMSFGVDTQSLENYVKKFLKTGRQDPYFHTGGTG